MLWTTPRYLFYWGLIGVESRHSGRQTQCLLAVEGAADRRVETAVRITIGGIGGMSR